MIGDECTPKFFLSGQLVLSLGSVREERFYWQKSYPDYLYICAASGLFHVDVPLGIDWIEVAKNRVEAIFHPKSSMVFESISKITLVYREPKTVTLEVKMLFSVPLPKPGAKVEITYFNSIQEKAIWLAFYFCNYYPPKHMI